MEVWACTYCGRSTSDRPIICEACDGRMFIPAMRSEGPQAEMPVSTTGPTIPAPNPRAQDNVPTARPRRGGNRKGRNNSLGDERAPDEQFTQSKLSRWSARIYGQARSTPIQVQLKGNVVVALFDVIDAASHWRDEKCSKRCETRLLIALAALEKMIDD